MKKVLLYILRKDTDIIAISEYKSDIITFAIYNNLNNSNDYTINVIKNQKSANMILSIYEDLYLTEYKGYIIRYKDEYPIKDMEHRLINKINNTIDGLDDILELFNIESMKDIELYKKSIKRLKKTRKRLNIAQLIKSYYESIDLRCDSFINIKIKSDKEK
jgi:hypothetical protein